MKKNKTAIILGATGLTGNLLLGKLLDDDSYAKVKIFARRSVRVNHPKIQEFLGDITELENFKADFTGDEVFCCIGTTKAKTPNPDLYHAIDVGIPATAARLAEDNNIGFFAVISAMGADINSRFSYNRLKGEMEQKVQQAQIPHTYILRPSLIMGSRSESRLAEDWGNKLFKLLSPLMIGALEKYRPINAENIANAFIDLAKNRPNQTVLLSDEITNLSEKIY